MQQVISDDSLIFRYCKEGDIDGVRQLLDSRQASVNDMTTQGMTALHVSQFPNIHLASNLTNGLDSS